MYEKQSEEEKILLRNITESEKRVNEIFRDLNIRVSQIEGEAPSEHFK